MMEKPKYIEKECKHHGLSSFVLEGRGYYRCRLCRQEAVAKRRRKTKEILVQEHGGKCQICGYDKYQGALEFHHIDPNTKKYGVASKGRTGLSFLRKEAEKCVLLCANCHREVEAGLISGGEMVAAASC